MPSGKVHILFGAVTFVIALYLANRFGLKSFNISLMPLWVMGALLPDIDSVQSMGANHFRKFSISFIVLGGAALWYRWNLWLFVFVAFCVAVLFASLMSAHRTFFHSPVAAFLLSLPLLYFGGVWWMAACFGGFLSHLLVDGELFQGGPTG